MRQGTLAIVSGFSGVGKGTVVKDLVKRYPYALSISATTRQPREGEQHGRDYYFIQREEFEEMIRRGELFEWARYVDNYYGTPKSFAMEALAEGRDVILEIEVQGALKIKAMVPEALMIFVVPPSMQVLKERLVGRGTESQEAIAKRLRRTVEELPFVQQYEYVVINHTVESCADEIHAIVSASHAKLERNLDHLENLRLQGMEMDAK